MSGYAIEEVGCCGKDDRAIPNGIMRRHSALGAMRDKKLPFLYVQGGGAGSEGLTLGGLGTTSALSTTPRAQTCAKIDWTSIQRALNLKLSEQGQRTLTIDGKMCCGKSATRTGHLVGGSWNALAWWLGPKNASDTLKASGNNAGAVVDAINRGGPAILIEVPDPDQVGQVQVILGLRPDGCLGPVTAKRLSTRLPGWEGMKLPDVIVALGQAPIAAEGSGLAPTAATPPGTPSVTKAGLFGGKGLLVMGIIGAGLLLLGKKR